MTEDLKGKRLMLLGGVRPTCEIIREAHKIGVEVYETDYLTDSPAKKAADKSFMTSCTDVDAVVELCKQQGVDGVFTGYTDSLLPYTERVCQKLGKPFWGTAENIDMSIDKQKFKAACEKSGVPVVPWKLVTSKNYIEELDDVEVPVVIKPVDNSGSRGVFKCYKKEDLHTLCEQSLSFSKKGEVMIERQMNANNEFSVYYIMNHGNIYLTGMGDRYIYELSPEIAPVGHGMLFPSTHVDQWIEEMDSVMKKFFIDNDMNDGFVFVQGFYENGKFYIHEIGYRLNGGFSFKLIEHFSGYNQIQQLVRFSLTGDMEAEEIGKSDPRFNNGIGMILTATLGKGTISKIKGVEEARQLPGVIEFYQLKELNTTLSTDGTTAQVFAYIILAATSPEDLKELVLKIESLLDIYDENGLSMLLPMIDPQRLKFYNR